MASETVGYVATAKGIDRDDNSVSIGLAVIVEGDNSEDPTHLERLFERCADAIRAAAAHFDVGKDNLQIRTMGNQFVGPEAGVIVGIAPPSVS